MGVIAKRTLIRNINYCLRQQGYTVKRKEIFLPSTDKKNLRKIQNYHRNLKLSKYHFDFIKKHKPLALEHACKPQSININRIQIELIEVQTGEIWETLFKWWCLLWWSIPYEKSIGRQMRFIVWDSYHKSVVGLIGLQSPILSWRPRDRYLNINRETKVLWVNQSLSAQRVGAIPPYNRILGSRLIASLLISQDIRQLFENKYKGRLTLMNKNFIPNRLLFITTTGAFGKTPVYDRHNYQGQKTSFFLGYTQGYGSFHISDNLYLNMIDYLKNSDFNTDRGYGNGPSRKMRLINLAMNRLGYKTGTQHQVKRGVYLFTSVKNLKEVINHHAKPHYLNVFAKDLTEFWKQRWILPRLNRYNSYKKCCVKKIIEEEIQKIESYG